MRKLGISVYPEHASLEENKKYIELAAKYGFSRIFTCLLSVEGDKEKIINDFKEMISFAKQYIQVQFLLLDAMLFSQAMKTSLNVSVPFLPLL